MKLLQKLLRSIYPATRSDAKKILAALEKLQNPPVVFNPSYERFTAGLVAAWRDQTPSALLPIPFDFQRVCDDLRLPHTPPTSEVCVCDLAIGQKYRALVEPCLQSHKAYASKHQLDYYTLSELTYSFTWGGQRYPSWAKIPLICRLLSMGYKKVLFLDADTLIKNYELTWKDFFLDADSKAFFCLALEEEAHINTGVLLFRESPYAAAFLAAIWGGADRRYLNHVFWEQDTLLHVLSENPEFQDMMSKTNSKLLQSCVPLYAENHNISRDFCYQKDRGDFLVHFKGLRGAELERSIQEYLKK